MNQVGGPGNRESRTAREPLQVRVCEDDVTIGLCLEGERSINWPLLNAARRYFEFPKGDRRSGFRIEGARLTEQQLQDCLKKKSFLAYRDASTGMLRMFYRELCIRFADGLPGDERDAWLAEHHLTAVRSSLLRRGVVYARQEAAGRPDCDAILDTWQRLRVGREVLFAAPNFVSHFQRCASSPVRPVPSRQWHLRKIRAAKAWETATGKGVTIAIIDDGVDTSHPALSAKLARDRDGNSLERNLSPLEPGDDPLDATPRVFNPDTGTGGSVTCDYHGTACAGVAASDSAKVRGVAVDAQILPIKIFRGDEMAEHAHVADAIVIAARQGARVLSCSWFAIPDPDVDEHQIKDAIRRVVADGAVVVCAAGNDGSTDIREPAAFADCIAVGASSKDDGRAENTNFGNGIWVFAPSRFVPAGTGDPEGAQRSVGITTTDCRGLLRGYKPGNSDPADPQGLVFDGFGGTSAATAIVAGLTALLLEVDPKLNATGVKSILRDSAVTMPGGIGFRIDAAAAVSMARKQRR